jgi:hypothetical protein
LRLLIEMSALRLAVFVDGVEPHPTAEFAASLRNRELNMGVCAEIVPPGADDG